MTKITLKQQLTEFLLYSSPNGEIKVEVFLHEESLWLNQKNIAELFDVDITTITTSILKEYVLKGFVMDDDKLKNGKYLVSNGKILNFEKNSSERTIFFWEKIRTLTFLYNTFYSTYIKAIIHF